MAEQHLDPKQVRKAVKALLGHRQQKNTLDLDAAAFTLQVGLKKAPVDPSPKPRLIPLPHRVRNDAGDRRGCLIVKDADKPWLKALLLDGERPGAKTARTKLDGTRAAKMARRSESMREAGSNGDDLQIEGIHKVLAMSKLRTSYKQYKDRRELRDRFDDFYCDDRVVPMLGKLLGKSFFDRKRQPISVRVTRGPESLREQLRKADSCARFVLKEGTCAALVCATTDLDEKATIAPGTTAPTCGVRAQAGAIIPGAIVAYSLSCAFVTRDLKPQTGRHARGAARPTSVARPPHARLERSRAPLPLPPRGRAGRLAAAHAPARSNTSAATARTLIRPPHREVQRSAAPRL